MEITKKDAMSVEEFQAVSARFRRNKYEPLTGEQSQLLNWTVGLCGEAGEVGEVIKKYIWHDHPLDMVKLEKEVGDVMWYLAQLCNDCEINLVEILAMNYKKLSARYPNGFTAEDSINRVED